MEMHLDAIMRLPVTVFHTPGLLLYLLSFTFKVLGDRVRTDFGWLHKPSLRHGFVSLVSSFSPRDCNSLLRQVQMSGYHDCPCHSTMDFHKKMEKLSITSTRTTNTNTNTNTNTGFNITNMWKEQTCTNLCCFFCLVKEPKSSIRRVGIASFFKELPLIDDQEHVMVLKKLWNMAMTQPDDPEFPSLGIFECMAKLIHRGLANQDWLLRDQNINIPYYAAHVIGSYTMSRVDFAEKAVDSGVIPQLMELFRGRMSWVEQRVAVRALGHLASYESTFEAVAEYETEVINLAMHLASTCLEEVYTMFVGVKDRNKRVKYHRDLLTRGVGGLEMENRKAEEWASQLQYWSLYVLNSFAIKGRSITLMCKQDFLKQLCEMWGGLVNQTSPAGIGLLRILCYSEIGRRSIAESQEVIEKLCNLSRSSDDWQYMGIDCLLLLLTDPDTRYKVIEIATLCLVDLIELTTLGERSNVGEAITRTLLIDFSGSQSRTKKSRAQRTLEEIWDLKVERSKQEKMLSDEKVEEKRVLVRLIKQEGNHSFWVGEIEEALLKYTQALLLCPLRLRKERVVLYSNRAQCHLLLSDPDSAVSDATRALCLSSPVNSHGKSLWRRSQAYDMKGLAIESLIDCIVFINGCNRSEMTSNVRNVPYYAARMISKQMDRAWLFATAMSKTANNLVNESRQSDGNDDDDTPNREHPNGEMMRMMTERKGFNSGLPTIGEEPLIRKGESSRRKLERSRGKKKCCHGYHTTP
ncbi:unnamed protein product [Camellia sinensis]